MLINSTPEEIEKSLENMDAEKLDRIADNLRTIALFVAKRELRAALARRLSGFSNRLESQQQVSF